MAEGPEYFYLDQCVAKLENIPEGGEFSVSLLCKMDYFASRHRREHFVRLINEDLDNKEYVWRLKGLCTYRADVRASSYSFGQEIVPEDPLIESISEVILTFGYVGVTDL